MSKMRQTPMAIAAGGTGGHLFPAQSLAQELKRRGHQVVLFTDERVRDYGQSFPADHIYVVPSATLVFRKPLSLPGALLKLAKGTFKAWAQMGKDKPQALIAFGGYPSLPPVFAALMRGVPLVLHEQNAVMGRANRLAARWADAVAGSFAKVKYLPDLARNRLVQTGNPVRDAVIEAAHLPYPEPDMDSPFHLLVFGGSQGARAFSQIIPQAVDRLSSELKARLKIVQQCRPEDIDQVREIYLASGVRAELNHFFDDMPSRIAAAHLVISRSGASTVAEIACIGRPAIFVPFPHALDQDQKVNATVLSDAGGGWVWDEKSLNPDELAKRVSELMNSPHALKKAAEGARRAGEPDAVSKLADLVEKTAK